MGSSAIRIIEFSSFPDTYLMENVLRHPISSNLSQEIENVLKEGKQPSAFIWNDLVILFQKGGVINHYQMQWPSNDEFLSQQVSSKGRCAIHFDILNNLYKQGLISSLQDTSRALDILRTQSDCIYELNNVFRFVGLEKSHLYQPKVHIKSPNKANSISVIINYRDRPNLVKECLKSIARQKLTANLEILLIDNQSQAKNRAFVETISQQIIPPSIKVKHLTYDAPFNHSEQCNLGVDKASGDVVVMLNNDALLLSRDLLQTISNWAITPGIATVGPKFVGEKGKLISSGVQTCLPVGDNFATIRESTILALSKTLHYSAGNSFACAAINRKVWQELGGLNAENFPSQYNDADFFLRSLDAGLKHLYVGYLTAYHQPGKSEKRTRETVKQIHNKLVSLYPHLGQYSRLAPGLIKLHIIVDYEEFWPHLIMNSIIALKRFRKKINNIYKYLKSK